VPRRLFLLPLIRHSGSPGVLEEPLHTLAQVLLEMIDDASGGHATHLKIYTFNELYLDFLGEHLRLPNRLLQWPGRWLPERLLIVQGFLHSRPLAADQADPPTDGSGSASPGDAPRR
jgi:hypothetical protein